MYLTQNIFVNFTLQLSTSCFCKTGQGVEKQTYVGNRAWTNYNTRVFDIQYACYRQEIPEAAIGNSSRSSWLSCLGGDKAFTSEIWGGTQLQLLLELWRLIRDDDPLQIGNPLFEDTPALNNNFEH